MITLTKYNNYINMAEYFFYQQTKITFFLWLLKPFGRNDQEKSGSLGQVRGSTMDYKKIYFKLKMPEKEMDKKCKNGVGLMETG